MTVCPGGMIVYPVRHCASEIIVVRVLQQHVWLSLPEGLGCMLLLQKKTRMLAEDLGLFGKGSMHLIGSATADDSACLGWLWDLVRSTHALGTCAPGWALKQ